MLKRAVEATPGLRRPHSRRPRPVHVGRDAARVLPEQHPHDRRDGRVHPGARRRARASRCSAAPAVTAAVPIAKRPSPRILPYLRGVVSSNRRVDRALRRLRRCADVCELDVGGGPVPDGDELSRIISCARASRRCSFRGIRRGRISPQLGARIGERVEQVPQGLRRVLRRAARTRARRSCATRTPRWSSIPGLGLFGFGKDKREARITSEFFVNAIHVMAGANALEDDGSGRRSAAAGAPSRAGARLQELPQLRRAAADGGVPDRVLGARRGQAAAHAAPRRSSAGRSSSSSAAAAASAAKSRSRSPSAAGTSSIADTNIAGAEETKTEAATALVDGDGAWRRRWISTARDTMAAGAARRRAPVRRLRLRRQHRRLVSDAGSVGAGRRGVGARAADQPDVELRAGAGSGEGAEGAEPAGVDRAHQLGQRRRAEERERGRTT